MNNAFGKNKLRALKAEFYASEWVVIALFPNEYFLRSYDSLNCIDRSSSLVIQRVELEILIYLFNHRVLPTFEIIQNRETEWKSRWRSNQRQRWKSAITVETVEKRFSERRVVLLSSRLWRLSKKRVFRSRSFMSPAAREDTFLANARNARTCLHRRIEALNSWLLVSCWRCGFEMNPHGPDGLKTLKCNSCRMFYYLRAMLTRWILETDSMLLSTVTNFDFFFFFRQRSRETRSCCGKLCCLSVSLDSGYNSYVCKFMNL